MMDVADLLTDYTFLSGSIALIVKLNDVTNTTTMNVESEAIHVLNSRNVRLVAFEYNVDTKNQILERSAGLTNGFHYAATANDYQTVLSAAFTKTGDLIREPSFRNRRIQVRNWINYELNE